AASTVARSDRDPRGVGAGAPRAAARRTHTHAAIAASKRIRSIGGRTGINARRGRKRFRARNAGIAGVLLIVSTYPVIIGRRSAEAGTGVAGNAGPNSRDLRPVAARSGSTIDPKSVLIARIVVPSQIDFGRGDRRRRQVRWRRRRR